MELVYYLLSKAASVKWANAAFGREEATRTPDPHVPNVVRYQLRYFSNLLRKFEESLDSSVFSGA